MQLVFNVPLVAIHAVNEPSVFVYTRYSGIRFDYLALHVT
jgi:hypothetical protein